MSSSKASRLDALILDRAVQSLQEHKAVWAGLPLSDRLGYLHGILERTGRVAPRQVRAACEHKGVPFDSPVCGEEWFGGPMIQARVVRLLLESLSYLARHKRARLDEREVHMEKSGRVAVDVFPASTMDRLLYAGFSAEVWQRLGITPASLAHHMGGVYGKGGRFTPRCALVLGAGNVASIAPLDLVHKLFVEGQVALLKLNPVNDYLGQYFEEVFAELIRDGFVRLAYGGAEAGDYLCQHPGIDEIHITGSDRTYEAIVWGSGEEAVERRRRGEPRIQKRITSELGNVSPVIVMPGPWSEGDLQYQAENVATQLANNAGFNCNAARVVITWRSWPQRGALLEGFQAALRRAPLRPAYYPGAYERFDRFLAGSRNTITIGERRPGVLPWAIAADVDPEDRDSLLFRAEAFCGLCAETALDAPDPAEFLRRAVRFANERLFGTLNACIIIDPATASEMGEELEEAKRELRYGVVSINHWPAIAFGIGTVPWGGYPSQTPHEAQSGTGFVHNTRLFDDPEKSILTGPFRAWPKPPWFITHSRAQEVGRLLTEIEVNPSLTKVPRLVVEALRG